jgi:hypothetical protein
MGARPLEALLPLRAPALRAACVAIALSLGGVAWAQEIRVSPRQAQAAALRAEMDELAARAAWRGVEANYGTLLEIAPKGVRLTSTDHRLAARAALSRGDVDLALRRLLESQETGVDPEATALEADLLARFAPVTLDAPEQPLLSALEPSGPEDEELAVAYAKARLLETGAFAGWLPMGMYQVGERRFVVDGMDLPLIVTTRDAPVVRARQRDGLVVDAGLGLVVFGGDASSQGASAAPMTGYGPRLGVAWSRRVAYRWGYGGGVALDAAWEGGAPATTSDGQPDLVGRLGLVTLHADAVLGAAPLQLQVGPAWTLGGARARATCDGCAADEVGPLVQSGIGLLGVQAVAAAVPREGLWAGQLAVRAQTDGDRLWMGVSLGGRLLLNQGR